MPRALSVCICLMLVASGCQKSEPAAPPAAPPQPVQAEAPPAAAPAKPDPSVRWNELLSQAQQQLEADELSQAEQTLNELMADAGSFDDDWKKKTADLQAQLEQRQAEQAAKRRAAALAEAQRLVTEGDLEGATRAADTVLNSAPTEEERLAAGEVKQRVDAQRRARLRLRTAMRLLASDKRADVRAAQEQLYAEQEAAWPLVIEAARGEDPVLAANALEMLRILNNPQRSTPAMIAVLAHADRQATWPAAVKELAKLGQPGAGEPLLELALASDEPQQRAAILTALAGVVDPPAQTAIALLPLIYQDDAALAAALAALHRAVEVHRQYDLLALRGVSEPLNSQQSQLLTGLPQRLKALVGDKPSVNQNEVAYNAMKLGIALRLISASVLEGAKVARSSGEEETSPASAVVDGKWTSDKPEHQWRHSLSGQAYLVLDLGREATITGIRVWNYNQPGAQHRGWKEVDIYVDTRPALLAPVADGLVPMAPPTADASDYGATLAVPFIRGRYVKLQPRGYWRPDSVSGLAEVQILGFE